MCILRNSARSKRKGEQEMGNYSAERARDLRPSMVAYDAGVHYGAPLGHECINRVIRDITDAIEEGRFDEDDESDVIHELADSAVPVYTDQRFLELVEFRAYHEDVNELAPDSGDMVHLAAVALYMTYERLYRAALDLSIVDEDEDA